jgi:hypothetical protein
MPSQQGLDTSIWEAFLTGRESRYHATDRIAPFVLIAASL